MIRIPIHRFTRRVHASAGRFDHEWATEIVAVGWFVKLQFWNPRRLASEYQLALIDTGAQYSVVPHRFADLIRYRSLGRQLTADAPDGDDESTTNALAEWDGIACDMITTSVLVVDPDNDRSSSKVCEFIGKLAMAPHPKNSAKRDLHILLGAHFLTHNRIQLVLNEAGTGDYLLLPE